MQTNKHMNTNKETTPMYSLIHLTTTRNNSTSRSPLRRGVLGITRALALVFALALTARAVNPPPDGGYPNFNTAEGDGALFSLTNGISNTALGFNALHDNTGSQFTGRDNTAVGSETLSDNRTGSFNTAIGSGALNHNKRGSFNTATGDGAIAQSTSGSNNTATGHLALVGNSGDGNTAIGALALVDSRNGSSNTAVGLNALARNDGNHNIALGANAGFNLVTGVNNIYIGDRGVQNESNTIRIGTQGRQRQTYVAGIFGVTVPGGVTVIADSNGQLGTVTSSERFKDKIKPMDKASEAILALKPVTFRYRHELDPEGIPQFGLVAEEVERINPDLVARDDQGTVYTVRYEAVNAMLLNEFLKEHSKVQTLEATAAQQQKEIKALTASLKEQASQIRKVSDQLEASKATPQIVVSNQ
jgi:hypothetical protein